MLNTLTKLKELINKFRSNNLNKNTTTIYIVKIKKLINKFWNFLKTFILLTTLGYVSYCHLYIYFELFRASYIELIYNVSHIELSKEFFRSMQETYPIFGKNYWHIHLTDIFSKNSYYPRYLEHLEYLSSPDYLNAERVIQTYDDREFNNSKVRTVFIGRIQNYNLRHVITTNEEYDRCLLLFETNYSNTTSIENDSEKFLFIQEIMERESRRHFFILLGLSVGCVLGCILLDLFLDWRELSFEIDSNPDLLTETSNISIAEPNTDEIVYTVHTTFMDKYLSQYFYPCDSTHKADPKLSKLFDEKRWFNPNERIYE